MVNKTQLSSVRVSLPVQDRCEGARHLSSCLGHLDFSCEFDDWCDFLKALEERDKDGWHFHKVNHFNWAFDSLPCEERCDEEPPVRVRRNKKRDGVRYDLDSGEAVVIKYGSDTLLITVRANEMALAKFLTTIFVSTDCGENCPGLATKLAELIQKFV